MNGAQAEQHARRMMMRAIALSKESGAAGEYPYGVLTVALARWLLSP
jgi:hypothetical protein